MILALETSADTSSVALLDGSSGALKTEVNFPSRQQLSQTLMGRLDEALQEASATLDDLRALAVSLGPGSFTSLRIGVATAKCLAHARGLPIVGVPTHQVIARGAQPAAGRLILVATRARANEVYATLLRARDDGGFEEVRPCEVLSPAEATQRACKAAAGKAQQALLCGDAAGMCAEAAPAGAALTVADSDPTPKASDLARLAALRLQTEGPDDLFSLKPLYARPSQAEAKLEVDLGL
ncbi:MAG: tRNA (adenosine(37)-N6)-threonylcarbamoyltransferase complex dimerization subunit type 1 TsaB [Armatimonadota bacterium]